MTWSVSTPAACFECLGRGWVAPDSVRTIRQLRLTVYGVRLVSLCPRCGGSGREAK